ncbi:hypothetical protein V5O48_000854 [Marasmius crinis-equi]|uniref:Uncharacterized protein n=1 Tax=Marasmius crinis-equi TaxID=585013 RepID=A0ABR3G012_9AGAR
MSSSSKWSPPSSSRMYPVPPTMQQSDSPYVVDESFYSHSPSFSPHIRHYPPSYPESSSYRLAAPVVQQYDLETDHVPSLSRMKRASSSTINPMPPSGAPQFTRSQSTHDISSLPSPVGQLSPDSDSFASEPPRRKSRQKPKIELAADQPTTTQGKQRKRVYVACLQWYAVLCSMMVLRLADDFQSYA